MEQIAFPSHVQNLLKLVRNYEWYFIWQHINQNLNWNLHLSEIGLLLPVLATSPPGNTKLALLNFLCRCVERCCDWSLKSESAHLKSGVYISQTVGIQPTTFSSHRSQNLVKIGKELQMWSLDNRSVHKRTHKWKMSLQSLSSALDRQEYFKYYNAELCGSRLFKIQLLQSYWQKS